MLRKSHLCILLFVLILASSALALTGKIGNPRVALYADVTPSKPAFISKYLEVINDNDVAVNINMEVSENCTDIIKLGIQEGFTLQPDQSKKVPYTVKVTQPGFYECKINTYFKVQDDKGPGVALASAVVVIAKGKGPATIPSENITEKPGNIPENVTGTEKNDDDSITGGVSVNPGGKVNIKPGKTDYNIFAISFFILMLLIVALLAFVVLRRRK